MNILIWLLTFVLILDCLLLILLVLIQLPKKEAGLGQAFGGGATDALFGAGSGSALTTLTRYSAGIFFAATLLLSVLNSHQAHLPVGTVAHRDNANLRRCLTHQFFEIGIPGHTQALTQFTRRFIAAAPDGNQFDPRCIWQKAKSRHGLRQRRQGR